jgi:hypothetical protein
MWLPDSYPTAPTAVTAIFAGLLTKVGVFVIIRTQMLMFPHEGPSTLLLFVAGATMLVGVLGAIAQNDIKRILSFHIVSQIGYMIMGLGFLSGAGLAASIVFVANQIIVKTGLFLVGGLVEAEYGTGSPQQGGRVASSPAFDSRHVRAAGTEHRRNPALRRLRSQARPGPGRRGPGSWRDRGGEPGGQPAHPVLDDQDLGSGVLGNPRRRR